MNDKYLFEHSNDRCYAEALDELKKGTVDNIAWAKALSESEGNKQKAEALYIKLRVHDMVERELSKATKTAPDTRIVNERELVNVDGFSKKTRIPAYHIIVSIQKGDYKGGQWDGVWYVDPESVGESFHLDTKTRESGFANTSFDDFDLRYMPISEFSVIKGIPQKKLIEMIRDGFYAGQIKNNSWYVRRDADSTLKCNG
jgi:hypothetical protein